MQFAVINDALLELYFNRNTSIDDGELISAQWSEAEIGRVAQYFNDSELKHPIYEIALPSNALEPPYNVKYGTELQNLVTGWTATVRKLTAPDFLNNIAFVHCIAVILPRG